MDLMVEKYRFGKEIYIKQITRFKQHFYKQFL